MWGRHWERIGSVRIWVKGFAKVLEKDRKCEREDKGLEKDREGDKQGEGCGEGTEKG